MVTDAERIIGLYRRHARAWMAARRDWPGQQPIEAGWLDRFRALLSSSCPVVLDLGCGCGEPVARYLVERGCNLTGVDSAPEMIAMCEARLPGHSWRVGDMRTLSLDHRFDDILAWDSFFHLSHDDQRRMFPLFSAHAAPGAALMFTSGPEHGVAMGTLDGEPLYHASLSGAEYRALLDKNGFAVVAQVTEDPTCGGRTIWLAQPR